MVFDPCMIDLQVGGKVRILVPDVDHFTAVSVLASLTATFHEEIHGNHHVKRVSHDGEILIDLRIVLRQPVPPSLIEMTVNAFHLGI